MCMSMTMAGEMGAVMALATERAARSGRMGRMAGVPCMVSQPSQGHHGDASRTECQAKRIQIHKITACKILHPRDVDDVERVALYTYFASPYHRRRLPRPAIVWYGTENKLWPGIRPVY